MYMSILQDYLQPLAPKGPAPVGEPYSEGGGEREGSTRGSGTKYGLMAALGARRHTFTLLPSSCLVSVRQLTESEHLDFARLN